MVFLTPSIHQTTALSDGGSGTITLDVCSEFVEYPFRSSSLSIADKLFVVKDAGGQPIIIVKSGEQLLAYAHVRGGPVAWQRFVLTPDLEGATLGDYDVKQMPKGKSGDVLLSFSTRQPQGRLYHAVWKVPDIAWDEKGQKIDGIGNTGFMPAWSRVDNPDLDIDALSISQSTSDNFGLTYSLIVGTAEYQNKAGAHYLFDPNAAVGSQFTFFPLAGVAQAVFQIQAASLNDGPGAFTLFRHLGTNVGSTDGAIGLRFDLVGANLSYALNIDKLEDIQKIRHHLNPDGQTDLFVACESGVAFYNYLHIDADPVLLFEGIDGFHDVVTSESPIDAATSKIILFALSHSSALYYLEGTRDLATKQVKFMATTSWETVANGSSQKDHALCHPIRQNVSQISAQYNAHTNACELVYLGNGEDEVRHLWKDENHMWHEQNILIYRDPRLDAKPYKYPSYVTTISFKDGKGTGLSQYPCTLSSDYSFVLINDRSYTLDSRPIKLLADGSGKISIVRRVGSQLAVPQYTVKLQDAQSSASHTQNIEPAQRVLRGLGSISEGKQIADAVDTRGKKVFENEKHDFDFVASVTKGIAPMAHKVDPKTATDILGPLKDVESAQGTHSWESDGLGNIRAIDANDPFMQAMEAVGEVIEGGLHILGEIFEWLRAGFKAVVKVAIKYYYGPLVRFFIKIGTKILHFAIENIGPVIRSITTFLDEALGTNLTKLLDWLGFIFDPERTRKTQKVLVDAAKNCLTTTQRFIKVNNAWIKRELDVLRDLLKKFIKDTRPQIPGLDDGIVDNPITTVFDFLFDNPILGVLWHYTPMAVILEAVTEDFGDLFQVPDISALTDIIGKVVPTLAEAEIKDLLKLLTDLCAKLMQVLSDPFNFKDIMSDLAGDIIWTIFDAVKPLVVALLDSLENMCDGVLAMLEGKWVIPGISEEWTEFTGTDMTILDLITFLAAEFFNLYTISVGDGKELFHDDPDAAQKFLIDEKYLSLETAFNFQGSIITSGSVSHLRPMAMFFEEDNSKPMKKAAKKWSMLLNVLGRSCGTAFTLFEVLHTVADIKEMDDAIEMTTVPPNSPQVGLPPNVTPVRFGRLMRATRQFSTLLRALKAKNLIEKTEHIFAIGGNILSAFFSLGSLIATSVYLNKTSMRQAMPNSPLYIAVQSLAVSCRIGGILLQAITRKSEYRATFTAVPNFIAALDSWCAEVLVDYLTEDEKDAQGQKMVAAASTELTGSGFGVASSILAVQVKDTENPYVAIALLCTEALDCFCSISGVACVSSVIHDTGMQNAG